MVFSLTVFTAMRRERSALHTWIAVLLGLILLWIVSMLMVAASPGVVHDFGLALMRPLSFALGPVYFLAMACYARVGLFERSRAAQVAVLLPFVLLYVGFLTNGWHGLVYTDPHADIASTRPTEWAGPMWWSFQVWTNAVSAAGIFLCLRVIWQAPSRAERGRALLLIAGAALPLVAHLAYVFAWLPLDYPLTPTALAVTALLIVAGMKRLRLLDVQPVVRRDVIEALSDGVVLADADGVVADVNPTAAAMLGRSQDDLHGTELSEILAQFYAAPHGGEALRAAIEGGMSESSPSSFQIETEDGRYLEVGTGSTGEKNAASVGQFVVLRDRTHEVRTEQHLHQKQKLESVGILAAGVAHEVNNPLSFVRANFAYLDQLCELVEEHADRLPEKVANEMADFADVLVESRQGLDRIGRIVESLLRFSRAPSTEKHSADVNEIVLEAIRFANLHQNSSVCVETDLCGNLPAIEASSDRLLQVFLNLFLNAKQALEGRADARVVAESRFDGAMVEVIVRDNGPGIAPVHRDRIFDPFFTTRGPGEGSGLGLSIAYDIVREHGGTLEATTRPECGARFAVRLPVPAVDVLP